VISLRANSNISNRGFCLFGAGFIVSKEVATSLGLGQAAGAEKYIKAYRNGRDLTDKPRNVYVIDLFGLTTEVVRSSYPAIYQHVLERVKPERDNNNRESRRRNWWIFGEPNSKLREQMAGLQRYIATVETAKHRTFQFLDASIAPDNMLVCIALDDAHFLGVLSSCVHVAWALAAGGRLGIGNDPRYNKSRCFEPFPFPVATDEQQTQLRTLAEQLDAHRKRQQAAYPDLTLTGMYNVLDKLRSGEALSAKERVIHEHGLVSVLRQLHDEIDAAVLDAYGWSDLLPLLRVSHGNDAATEDMGRDDAKRAFDEAILERLVALNAERAAEAARGLIRWRRPAFQHPTTQVAPEQAELAAGQAGDEAAVPIAATKPLPWPKDAVAQVRAVADALAASPVALDADALSTRFTARGPWKKRLPQLLDMLVALGRAREQDGRYTSH
jgi:hypothetical protein